MLQPVNEKIIVKLVEEGEERGKIYVPAGIGGKKKDVQKGEILEVSEEKEVTEKFKKGDIVLYDTYKAIAIGIEAKKYVIDYRDILVIQR